MKVLRRRTVYVMSCCAVLTIATFYANKRFPANTSAASRPVFVPASMTEVVEETVTLSASDARTFLHFYEWWSGPGAYCGPRFKVGFAPEEIAGSMVAGYKHEYDKGAVVLGCPDGSNTAYRGTVWFDLKSISDKAPPLHVFVKSATLHFRKDKEWPEHELLIAQEDWLTGYPFNKLVAGDPFAKLPECGGAKCAVDVQTVVNNWVRGEGHGGYANYGFVFKGPIEADLKYDNNDVCMTRYSDISLTVTYKYEKQSGSPAIRVGNPGVVSPAVTELAPISLALNKTATQSSTFTDGEAYRAVDGNSDGVWGSVSATGIESQAWWQVDLGKSRSIDKIKVWNRLEFADRTSDFYVFVSDEPFRSNVVDATKAQVGPARTFFTSGSCGRPTEISVKQTGRYVRVQLSGTNYLQLSEVEVFVGPK